ncbi:hypothetical protein [Rhodococcus sp. NPDC058481]|uniref:hypothetical protein n=1 Tax=unclassified Rhodococcus (in: high G+C Gram-positive bacteria) TaxID=192944 RepID=UPI003656EE47
MTRRLRLWGDWDAAANAANIYLVNPAEVQRFGRTLEIKEQNGDTVGLLRLSDDGVAVVLELINADHQLSEALQSELG